MAPWRRWLRGGLQSRLHRFESGRRLKGCEGLPSDASKSAGVSARPVFLACGTVVTRSYGTTGDS